MWTQWQRSLLGTVARPLFGPNEQALLLALPLFFVKIDYSSISYWKFVGNECKYLCVILKTMTHFHKEVSLAPGDKALPLDPTGAQSQIPILDLPL